MNYSKMLLLNVLILLILSISQISCEYLVVDQHNNEETDTSSDLLTSTTMKMMMTTATATTTTTITPNMTTTLLTIPTIINLTNIELLNNPNDKYDFKMISKNDLLQSNFTKLLRIGTILNVFDIEEIGRQWNTINNQLSLNCSMHMFDYLTGLSNGKLWAYKMDDASGHYTNGFFYGNNYFTGSLSLCTTIYQDDLENESDETLDKKHGLSFTHGYQSGAISVTHENPPFHPGFFMVKMLINETNLIKNPRTIHVGLCLPSSCKIEEVRYLTQQSQNDIEYGEIKILDVRSPTQRHYNYWKDKTFIILFIVTFTVMILLVLGTFYELLIKYQLKLKTLEKHHHSKELSTDSNSEIGCTTYDLTNAGPSKDGSLQIGIVIPRSINNNNSDENLAIQSVSSDDGKLSVFSELLLSFSIITNFKAICDRRVGNDTIPSIHGLRAISMAWVILGHTCIVVFKYSDNMELRKIVEKQFIFQTISNGAFSVDTFFFISGFLVSYIYFRTNAKGKLDKLTKGVNEITAGTFHFFGLLFYRFVRLTVPYLYVLGIVEMTMKYYETNSVFEPPTQDHINCPQYWWRNVLYINTLFPVEDMCMLWSWYLADDTQFYIIGAIILIIGVRHFKVASSILIGFMLSSWVTTGYIAFANNHMPNTDDPLALFDKIYDKPWTRLGPYLIGMSVGWILFKTNCKIRMGKISVIIGWSLSSACLLSIVYGLYNRELSQFTAAAYSSLSHSAWAISLAWIVIACSTGYGGWVNGLLSAPCIYPFSRVTYCAYLVHPLVIRLLALNSDSPLHLGTDSMVIIFFGQVVSSYVLSFIVSLSFEAPVVTMLKILSPNRKKR